MQSRGSAAPANREGEERSFGRGDPVRDYWLANAEGFRLADASGSVGVVARVEGDPAAPTEVTLRVRRGALRGETVVAAADVDEVVPARRLLLLRNAPEPGREPARTSHAAAGGTVGAGVREALERGAAALASAAQALVARVRSALEALRQTLDTRAERDAEARERARRERERARAEARDRTEARAREDTSVRVDDPVRAWDVDAPPPPARRAQDR